MVPLPTISKAVQFVVSPVCTCTTSQAGDPLRRIVGDVLDMRPFRSALEDEGYTVCRAYDCHGAGPIVSAWIESDGSAAPTAGRLDDFQQLSRLHLLAMAVQDESPDLFEALDGVGAAYQREGVFTMTDTARAALSRNQDLVEAVLARLAPGSFD